MNKIQTKRNLATQPTCLNCATYSSQIIHNACIETSRPLLTALIQSGSSISIEHGYIVIADQNGVGTANLKKDCSESLIKEILELLQIDAFVFLNHSTGVYEKKYPGVTLQFISKNSGENFYAIFNSELTRERNTKFGCKGSRLPEGQFRVRERSAFCAFWRSTKLAFPPRLSSFHDYLGNLKNIFFTAKEVTGRENRLDAQSLRPLSVPAEVICRRLLADNSRTLSGQAPDSRQTSMPDKEPAESRELQAFQCGSATCANSREEAVIRVREYKRPLGTPCQHKRPQDQTEEEWLADLSRPSAESW